MTIFAISFAMGATSGIVMSYQFGTNWSVFSDRAGPVIGPLMAYAVLTAFFLEAGFLGIMLFGRSRVGDGRQRLADRTAGRRNIAAFVVIYLVVFGAGVVCLLRLMAKRPGSPPSGMATRPG